MYYSTCDLYVSRFITIATDNPKSDVKVSPFTNNGYSTFDLLKNNQQFYSKKEILAFTGSLFPIFEIPMGFFLTIQ